MSRLINGKVRFSQCPQPIIETTDKFYLLGHGYTKYSLSPIKNDFCSFVGSEVMFRKEKMNEPIMSSVVSMKDSSRGGSIDQIAFDNMIISDLDNPDIEYYLRNSSSNSKSSIMKRDLKTNVYETSPNFDVHHGRSTIIGQSKDYIFTTHTGNFHIARIQKSDLKLEWVNCNINTRIDDNLSFYEKVLVDDDIRFIIGTQGVVDEQYRPVFIIYNKVSDSVIVKSVKLEDTKNGKIACVRGKTVMSRCSNMIFDKDICYSYFIITREKEGKYTPSLIKLMYDTKFDEIKYSEYSSSNGFDLSKFGDKIFSDKTICHLNVINKDGVDILSVINTVTSEIPIDIQGIPINSSLIVFNINKINPNITCTDFKDIAALTSGYHIFKLSENTFTLVGQQAVAFLDFNNKDLTFNVSNITPLIDSEFICVDLDKNLWNVALDRSVYLVEGAKTRIDIYCKFKDKSYTYTNSEINTTILVGIKDMTTGSFKEADVTITLSKNCEFRESCSNVMNVRTSSEKELEIPVIIKAAGNITANINLNFDVEKEEI